MDRKAVDYEFHHAIRKKNRSFFLILILKITDTFIENDISIKKERDRPFSTQAQTESYQQVRSRKNNQA